jgi:hypothetical protein
MFVILLPPGRFADIGGIAFHLHSFGNALCAVRVGSFGGLSLMASMITDRPGVISAMDAAAHRVRRARTGDAAVGFLFFNLVRPILGQPFLRLGLTEAVRR